MTVLVETTEGAPDRACVLRGLERRAASGVVLSLPDTLPYLALVSESGAPTLQVQTFPGDTVPAGAITAG